MAGGGTREDKEVREKKEREWEGLRGKERERSKEGGGRKGGKDC